jgi:hypothetical protein
MDDTCEFKKKIQLDSNYMPLIFLNIFQIPFSISQLFHSKLKPNKSSPHLLNAYALSCLELVINAYNFSKSNQTKF